MQRRTPQTPRCEGPDQSSAVLCWQQSSSMPVWYTCNDTIPTLTANGRLDAHGAAELDEVWQSVPADVSHVVFDLSGVNYLSSIGIRSLVSIEKTLRSRHGHLVLTGVTRFVSAVLETTGLLREFQAAASLNEALDRVRQAFKPAQEYFERSSNGRHYRFGAMTEEACFIDIWGSFQVVSSDPRTIFELLAQPPPMPVSVTAEELG